MPFARICVARLRAHWLACAVTRADLWPRRTDRLVLRPPTDADLDAVLRWRNDPAVTAWLLNTTVDPERYRRAWLDPIDDPLDHSVVAVLDRAVVGTGSLEIRDAMGQGRKEPDSPWADAEGSIGYLLDPAFHGRGLGTEMVSALLALAFEDLGLHRVTAACFADNIGSWRVMEKCGMRREQHGLQDSWHAARGWLDGYTYAVVRQEWLARSNLETQ